MHGHQGAADDVLPAGTSFRPGGGVLHGDGDLEERSVSLRPAHDHMYPPVHRLAATAYASGHCAVCRPDHLDLLPARERKPLLGGHALTGIQIERRQVDHLVDRFVPFHVGLPIDFEGLDRHKSAAIRVDRLHGPVLNLEAADPDHKLAHQTRID